MRRDDQPAEVAVIGAGPAGLAAAETVSTLAKAQGRDVRVTVFERMPSPARKLLIAGRGGLNLTHSEPLDDFLSRYGSARDVLEPAIRSHDPEGLRAWAAALGQDTFVGSSGRVFPRSFKASPLLRAWLTRLGAAGVTLRTRHAWTGWTADGGLAFETPEGPVAIRADATVLALGGASWPRLGADGGWTPAVSSLGVVVHPFRPANMGLRIAWSDSLRDRFAGTPLKGIALGFEGRVVRGEAMVTAVGLEGGAVYALSAWLREAVLAEGSATIDVDLKPDVPVERLASRLAAARKGESLSNRLRKAAGLPPVAVALMREAAAGGPSLPSDPDALAGRIKRLALRIDGIAGLERAISSAGGIALDEIDTRFMLRRRPGVFVAGEMLDWEAPTGGYLLQASFATGVAAGEGAFRWLAGRTPAIGTG